MHAAVRLNAACPPLAAIAEHAPSCLAAAETAAAYVRTALPYRFDGQAHRILDLPAAKARGYGACGDATAAVAAVLLMRGSVPILAYEATETLDGYAHVRIAMGRLFVDAYPEVSFSMPPRARIELTRESVRWPVRA
ncbi:MAG: hypothetical protein IT382_01860 [Deltaproteobacteria bacterium]|nr:hypothetical protein [Deltaproteobacteria bacterium]